MPGLILARECKLTLNLYRMYFTINQNYVSHLFILFLLAHGQDTLKFHIDFFEHCQQMQTEDVEVHNV